MSEAEAVVELDRLRGELRQTRTAAGLSVRAAAEAAGLNPSTVQRIESGQSAATYLRFARLAAATGHRLQVHRDGRVSPIAAGRRWPEGWMPRMLVFAQPVPVTMQLDVQLNRDLSLIGAELWEARQIELDPPLDGLAAAKRLGISPQTLARVEYGGDWPRLAATVRIAALTGRRLALVRQDDPGAEPPLL